MNLSILTLLISQMLIYSAPLIFTSLGGVFSERSGIVNVDSSENRSCPGYIEELDHENFPTRHGNVVDTIALGYRRSKSFRVWPEDLLYELAIK
jgi:hypothetical protein